MKKQIILGGFLALAAIVNAQWTGSSPAYLTSGKAGIGTSTPFDLLDIYNGAGGEHLSIYGSAPSIKFIGGTNAPSTNLPYSINLGMPFAKILVKTGTAGYVAGSKKGDFILQTFGFGAQPTNGEGRSIIFSTYFDTVAIDGKEQMRLNERGNLGVGTAAPTSKIHAIGQAGISTAGRFEATNPTGAYGVVGTANGGAGSQAVGVSGYASNSIQNIAGYFSATGNQTGDSYGIIAKVLNPQPYTPWIPGPGTPGSIVADWAGYFIGQTNVQGDLFVNLTFHASDKKLKKDIKPLENSIMKIKLLKPSTYNFRSEEFKDMNLPKEIQMGLIAQEVEEVFPELVKAKGAAILKDENGNITHNVPEHKVVNYVSLIPVLIAGIQEQQIQIENQDKENKELKQQMAGMQKQMDALVKNNSGNATGLNQLTNTVDGFVLEQNVPNPFSSETVINYSLPKQIIAASLVVYDLSGKQLTSFALETTSTSIKITSEKLAAGIYIYSVVADGKILDSKRMVITDK